MASENEIMVIRRTLAGVYNSDVDNDTAARMIAGLVTKDSLCEFIVDAFNRGWITRENLGIDDDGNLI